MSTYFIQCCIELYKNFFRWIERILPVFILLIIRIHWGWEFYQTGKGKLENHEQVVTFFTSLGIPAPNFQAWFVAGLEYGGGILLLLGLLSRPVSFMLACNMIVAYLSVAEDRARVFNIWNDTEAFLQADPFFFLLASLLVLAFGPGMISVDYLIKYIRNKE